MVNHVGPLHNPAETYRFYSLPFCQPLHVKDANDRLGNTLAGDRRRNSLYELQFQVNASRKPLCRKGLNQNEIKSFRDAILNNWVWEMFVDDLSIRGFVGEYTDTDFHGHRHTEVYLFTHHHFRIAYNGDHVIAVNVSTDPTQRVLLEFGDDLEVEFSYSVQWTPTTVKYSDRAQLHSLAVIGEQSVQIHWISIITSLALVTLLTGVLAAILMRVLRQDLARFVEMDDLEFGGTASHLSHRSWPWKKGRRPLSGTGGGGGERGGRQYPGKHSGGSGGVEEDESGWKHISTDVFRVPEKSLMLLCSALGTGTQLLVMAIVLLSLSLVGTFYPGNRGALNTAAIVLYAITAGIGGYVSSRLYVGFGGQKWALNGVCTGLLFPGPFILIFSVLNTMAVSYGSTSALPFPTMLILIMIWCLVTLPLTVFGVLRGRRHATPYQPPVKPRQARRPIPTVPWYRGWPLHFFVGGVFPFSAIYVELHYIFAAIWGHRVYTLFGILTIAFFMLVIVASFVSVALTFFQLANEDWRWWSVSPLC